MANVMQDLAQAKALTENYSRNKPFVREGASAFSTTLSPEQEAQFMDWVQKNKVPFDPSQQVQDYDMRGFYQGLMSGSPQAATAVNPNDGMMHYPDYWKTPYHKSFSAESQWANPSVAPTWNDRDQLVLPNGTIVFDERANK